MENSYTSFNPKIRRKVSMIIHRVLGNTSGLTHPLFKNFFGKVIIFRGPRSLGPHIWAINHLSSYHVNFYSRPPEAVSKRPLLLLLVVVVITFFAELCFALITCGTLRMQAWRNLASVGCNSATILPCWYTFQFCANKQNTLNFLAIDIASVSNAKPGNVWVSC